MPCQPWEVYSNPHWHFKVFLERHQSKLLFVEDPMGVWPLFEVGETIPKMIANKFLEKSQDQNEVINRAIKNLLSQKNFLFNFLQSLYNSLIFAPKDEGDVFKKPLLPPIPYSDQILIKDLNLNINQKVDSKAVCEFLPIQSNEVIKMLWYLTLIQLFFYNPLQFNFLINWNHLELELGGVSGGEQEVFQQISAEDIRPPGMLQHADWAGHAHSGSTANHNYHCLIIPW